jgi:hypothetical protein
MGGMVRLLATVGAAGLKALSKAKGKAKRKVLYKPTKTKKGKEELMQFKDDPKTVYRGYKKRFGKDKGEKYFFPDYKRKK